MRSFVTTSLYALAVLAVVIAAPTHRGPNSAPNLEIRQPQTRPKFSDVPGIGDFGPYFGQAVDSVGLPKAKQPNTNAVATKPKAPGRRAINTPIFAPAIDPTIIDDPTALGPAFEKTTGKSVGGPPRINSPAAAKNPATAKSPAAAKTPATIRRNPVGKATAKQTAIVGKAATRPANLGQQKVGPGGTSADNPTSKPDPQATNNSQVDDYQYNAAYPCIWFRPSNPAASGKLGDQACPPLNQNQPARRSVDESEDTGSWTAREDDRDAQQPSGGE